MTMIVVSEHAGKRLDTVAGTMVPGSSRSQIQKLIKEGTITVNGKKVSPHHFLKEGDTITVSSLVIPAEAACPRTEAGKLPPCGGIQEKNIPRVIAETPDYIIIDKPAGMVVHPGVRRECATLVDWLLVHYPEVRKAGDDPLRPGIVHRLDKDASGVMVVARTHDSFEFLVRQFKLRHVKKEYLALVFGRVTPSEGIINLPIGRSKAQYTKRAAHTKEGQAAITCYVVLQQFKHAALVRVMPETGRTHQIRVHFFAKGNPVVGDVIYCSTKIKTISAPRLMLNAQLLGFQDLSGERKEYSASPGKNFQDIVEQFEHS